jgi:hypothetical protein
VCAETIGHLKPVGDLQHVNNRLTGRESKFFFQEECAGALLLMELHGL